MLDQQPSRRVDVVVNGNPRAITANCTLASLILELGLERARIAVAVNRDVVPRSAYTTQRLTAGDRVEILEAVGGG